METWLSTLTSFVDKRRILHSRLKPGHGGASADWNLRFSKSHRSLTTSNGASRNNTYWVININISQWSNNKTRLLDKPHLSSQLPIMMNKAIGKQHYSQPYHQSFEQNNDLPVVPMETQQQNDV
ncbi:unnamed protein product [Arabidopsis halleri]